MISFEMENKLMDMAINSGNINSARKMALKSIPGYVQQSRNIVGLKQTYNDLLELNKSKKQRYTIRNEDDKANAV